MTASSGQGGNAPTGTSILTSEALQLLPPDIQAILKPGKTPSRIQSAINWASKRDVAVIERHQRHGHKVTGLEDVRNLSIQQTDHVARDFAQKFRRYAAITGGLMGLPGGLWAVVAAGVDVQMTAIYAVRMVADIAQSYGYDTSLTDEQTHLAEVLAIAAGIDTARGMGTWLTREGIQHMLPELLPKVLMRLSVELTQEQAARLVGRLIPGIGAIIGGSIDYTFLRVAGDRAIAYYHNRYLVDHGLASPDILPEHQQRPALSPAAAQALGASRVVEGSVGGSAPAAALPAPAVAPVGPARRKEHRPPERLAVYLGIFAIFALVATLAACGALVYLATIAVQHAHIFS